MLEDIKSINFQECHESFQKATQKPPEDLESIDDKMSPIEESHYFSLNSTSAEELQDLERVALDAIAKGTVGVICLAGGQGTRLGSPDPKGMFNIGLPSKKTLYQIQVERILKLEQMSGVTAKLPLYIMTSEHTKEPTAKFFAENDYFGMNKDNLVLFEQRMVPCYDFQGRILLASPKRVARAPDGNGGLYWALRHEGILKDMMRRGIKYVHVYCVDNVLVKMADPYFMGKCIQSGVESANKVVEKSFPEEAVGVVARIDGKVQVVEYSEISVETSELRNPDGKLTFRAGNICNHFFAVDFLSRVCSDEILKALPQHVAKKKIPHLADGRVVQPTEPNGIKLEKFVFDVFQFSNSFLVWECRRDEEFSPLKNADGLGKKDTPTTAREAVFSLHRKFVERAGGKIVTTEPANGPALDSSSVVCEISPLTSYAGEKLEHLVQGRFLEPPICL